jgi:hypothetical protein
MRHLKCLLIIIILFGTLLVPASLIEKANAQGQIVLNPTDDTYVDTAAYTSNFGSQTTLKLSSYQLPPSIISYRDVIWLKFNLTSASESIPAGTFIDSVKLQLYVVNITDKYNGTNVWPCDNNSWSESTLTFQNAPYGNINNTLYPDTEPVSNANQWQSWNVTAQIRDMYNAKRSAATLTVNVFAEYHSPSSYIMLCSKESSLGYPPELIIHWTSAPGKHQLSLLNVGTSKKLVMTGKPILINVLVQNTGDYTESFKVTAYATSSGSQSSRQKMQLTTLTAAPTSQKLIIGTQTVMNLASQGTKTVTFLWQTQGYTANNYIISSTITPLSGQLQIVGNGMTNSQGTMLLDDHGIWIFVAGTRNHLNDFLQPKANSFCGLCISLLKTDGYTNICFLNQPGFPDFGCGNSGQTGDNNNATLANLQWAITTWARSRMDSNMPFFMYMFDHGENNTFCVNDHELLNASSLSSWLDDLQSATGAQINVIYDACHSGSFIDEISKNNRIIITGTRASEVGFSPVDVMATPFSDSFWFEIKLGCSLMDSYNWAYDVARMYFAPPRWTYYQPIPLLDDNGDGVGHNGTMPNNGDGYLAANTYIVLCEWPFPWISFAVAKQTYSWPPPSKVTLWAQIENRTDLTNVTAWMIPPDWVLPPSNDTVIQVPTIGFKMEDNNHDGNWTVDIPAANFTNHASGPSNFTFYITAAQIDNNTAFPSSVSVDFASSGTAWNDTVSPIVTVDRPLEEAVVHNTIQINGTTTDDACLNKAELYVDGNLQDSVNLQPTSTSYFQFNLDTTTLANGEQNITVKAKDTSGNSGNQTLTIYVNNFVHDIALTDLTPSETSVQEGIVSNVSVTVANHGSYAEIFNLSLYANSTLIETSPVTLQSGNYTTVTFAWNTTGFTQGNYTLNAYAWPVLNEEDTTNNNLTLTEQLILIIPEFPSVLLLPTFMLVTSVMVMASRRKRLKSS